MHALADDSNTLLTIAEIGATFAGFAALVSALGRRVTTGRALHDLMRLRLVIGTSLIVVVTALVPSALALFDLAPGTVWRASAGLFLALTYLEIVALIAGYHRVRDEIVPDIVAVAIAFALQLVVQGALIAVLVGLTDRGDAWYVAALVALLVTAAIVFMRLVESAFAQLVDRD